MRRALVIGGGVMLAAAALWFVVSRSGAEQQPIEGEVAAPAIDFSPFAVRAAPTQQGLSLTGTVRDSSGQAVRGAEVWLAASGQQSLATVRCGTCGDGLLSCRAHESAQLVGSLLEQRRGELLAAAHTTTDGAGRFRFEQLAGISFTVWARAPGFGEGVKDRAAPGDPVDLFLPALRAVVGQLRDESGSPVAGTVRAVSRRLARYHETTAGPDGRFVLSGLGEGPFYLHGSAPGKLPAVKAQVQAASAEAAGRRPEPVVLTLTSPRRLEVRLLAGGQPVDGSVRISGDHLARELATKGGMAAFDTLSPGEVMVGAVARDLAAVPQTVTLDARVTKLTVSLDRGGTVSVAVLDEGGEPVPEPTVELLIGGGELVNRRKLATGELGLFGPLGVGEYQVRASAPGFGATTVPAAVTGGEVSVEVTLSRGTVISGRVIDEYGRPAPGVSVLISPTGDTVLADGEGRFRADVPSPGLYTLHAHHSDWGGGELKVAAPKSDVELQLEPQAGAQITVTSDGHRVEGASAVLVYPQGNFRSDRPSGADGVVLMRGLPPGPYAMVATHPEYLPSERQAVTLEDGVLLRVTAEVKRGAAVRGQVVDELGAPVSGVSVNVVPRSAEPALTDSGGSFSIGPLRPGGPYGLRVVARGLEVPERVLATAGGEPVIIKVRRQPLVRGRVLGDGQPLKRFRVDDQEVVSGDGRFEVPLPSHEGRVIVSIESVGFEPLMVDQPNSPDLGDLHLRRMQPLSGVVREEGGGAVPDAVVTCDTCEQSVLSGPDGRFSLAPPPYQHEFTVVAKKGRRTATRAIAADAPVGLELVLKAGVQLSGVAYLAGGRPAAGVEIAGLHVDRSEPVSVVTNADGTYALEVPPGVYRFMLAAPGSDATSQDPPAVITEIRGREARLDFGPVPGQGTLTVRVSPEAGHAVWLVRGLLGAVGNPPLELLRSSYAQVVYQPRSDRVTFGALAPGRYTVVWAGFHAQTTPGPLLVSVDVPSQAEVALAR